METCPVCKRSGDFLPDCPHFADVLLKREEFNRQKAAKSAPQPIIIAEKIEEPEDDYDSDSHPRRDSTQHEYHREVNLPYVVTKRIYGNNTIALQLAVIRFVGLARVYYQHFEPIICRSPGLDERSGICLDPLMLKGYEPKQRFACFGFDRLNQNKLEIVDFPPIIHEEIGKWMKKEGIDRHDATAPGMKEGPDFVITCQRYFYHNVQSNVCWSVSPTGPKPLTAEELKIIRSRDIRKNLAEMRRPNTPEEINAMLKMVADRATKKPDTATAPVKEEKKESDGWNF